MNRPISENPNPHPNGPVRFVAFGDGGSGLPAQQRIADQLIERHHQSPYDLILLLGDNIYPNGDALKYGEARFTKLYQPLLDRGVCFRPVLGNHDIAGPLGVGYPSFWMSNRRENMRFFQMSDTYYTFEFGPFEFLMLDTNRFRQPHRQWLQDKLHRNDQASDPKIQIACGHHPVFSSGFHGNTARLKRRLKPLLEKHGVPLYLSAHEHDYERFEPIQDVTYLISGGGGADLRSFRKIRPGSLIRESRHHFLAFEWENGVLRCQALDDTGIVFDHFERKLPIPTPNRLPQQAPANAVPAVY